MSAVAVAPAAVGNPLDSFIPEWTTRERFSLPVDAPAERVFQAAMDLDWNRLPLVRAIFRLREIVMRVGKTEQPAWAGLPDQARRLGWGVMVEEPGRLFLAGGYCQPWKGDVVFHPLTADNFRAFAEPGQVKIAFTIHVEPLGPARCRLSTETRTLATDPESERRFRRYWRWARFGIYSIRWLLLPAIRREATGRPRTGESG